MGAGEGERECVSERESPLSLPPHPSLALSLSCTNMHGYVAMWFQLTFSFEKENVISGLLFLFLFHIRLLLAQTMTPDP